MYGRNGTKKCKHRTSRMSKFIYSIWYSDLMCFVCGMCKGSNKNDRLVRARSKWKRIEQTGIWPQNMHKPFHIFRHPVCGKNWMMKNEKWSIDERRKSTRYNCWLSKSYSIAVKTLFGLHFIQLNEFIMFGTYISNKFTGNLCVVDIFENSFKCGRP